MSINNIALITNYEIRHRYWVSELYNKNNVNVIIHIRKNKRYSFKNIISKKPFFYGKLNFILKLFSIIYNIISSNSLSRKILRAEKRYFYNINKYDKIPKSKIHFFNSVNTDSAISFLKEKKITVVCFLGGEIINEKFIKSFKFCFNFHSGISPFYNGNKTNFHACVNYRPNFVGGTLMKMNSRIDGGDILMHFLPEIKRSDHAEDLFVKTIIGAVDLYNLLLNEIEKTEIINGVVQNRTFHFYRNIDWVINHDFRLNSFETNKIIKSYRRKSILINYLNKELKISDLYKAVLEHILNKND